MEKNTHPLGKVLKDNIFPRLLQNAVKHLDEYDKSIKKANLNAVGFKLSTETSLTSPQNDVTCKMIRVFIS